MSSAQLHTFFFLHPCVCVWISLHLCVCSWMCVRSGRGPVGGIKYLWTCQGKPPSNRFIFNIQLLRAASAANCQFAIPISQNQMSSSQTMAKSQSQYISLYIYIHISIRISRLYLFRAKGQNPFEMRRVALRWDWTGLDGMGWDGLWVDGPQPPKQLSRPTQ